MNRFRKLSTAKRAVLVVALLGALSWAAGFALAKNGPPAPNISSHPAGLTSSSSATFAFSDSQANVTFLCALDGAAYAACTSPTSYTGLSDGAHTFRVEARDPSGNVSSAASYAWTIDTTPPATSISFPAAGGSYNASGWNAGCSQGAGVCGSVSDPNGVSAATVSIKQNSSGRYWSGSSFSSTSETYLPAVVAKGGWFYSLAVPAPDGSYTLHVRATDTLGNATPAGAPIASTFTVLTAAPPPPSIDSAPTDPTSSTSASFAFSDAKSGVTFQCQLDKGKPQACSSPTSYSSLSASTHTFTVTAIDAAGNASNPATYSWQVVQQTNKSFTISGNVPAPLYPGSAAVAIPLRLSNPNNSAIYVTGLSVTVQSTGASACNVAWFRVNQLTIPSTSPITIPANGSVTLSGSGAPSIQMTDSGTNQDACQGASLTLSYAGSAHS